MILKVDLDPKEFASLGAFLASDENVVREQTPSMGLRSHAPKGSVMPTHFATLVTSKRSNGKHSVTLELAENWTELKEANGPCGWRVDGVLHSIPGRYMRYLIKSMGLYLGI